MKVIKVIFDNKTNFIVDIVERIKTNSIREFYNLDVFKEKKKAIPIQTRFGSKNLPLIVFEDENSIEYNAIWAENNPNWEFEIYKILNGNNFK